LAEGVCKVLEKVGMLFQNEEMLKALEKDGAKVDYRTQVATFPRKKVEEFAETLKQESARQQESAVSGFHFDHLPRLGLQVAQFFYDDEKRQKRIGNREDFIRLIKLGDVLHPEDGVGHCLLLADVPPLLEPLEAGMLLAEYAHKPTGTYLMDVRQMDYLLEMNEILGGQGTIKAGSTICFAHPLRLDRDVAARYVRVVKEQGHAGLTPMPVAGASTPITVEGFIMVASAEIIAAWMAARALNPKATLSSSMWSGISDMRGGVSYSSFDALFYGFAAAEFMRRWCGKNLAVHGGYGEYCDAKEPGLYAVWEKLAVVFTQMAFQGRNPTTLGQGMVECGKTLSPVQLLLERDVASGVNHLARRVEPSEERLSLDSIFEVGLGFEKSHIEMGHTLRWFRSCLWLPQLLDRSGWNGFEHEEEIMRKTQRKVNELIAQYKKPEVDADKLAKMRQVVEKARKHFYG